LRDLDTREKKENMMIMGFGFWLVNQKQRKTLILSLKNIQILIKFLTAYITLNCSSNIHHFVHH
jgi:hypothetical protein